MWKSRYEYIYKTKDPNLVITAVCSFPNLVDTIEKANEYYHIDRFKDKKYLEIMAYFELFHGGCDFVPVAFEDKVPKLSKLQKLNPIGKGYFWCIGYVSSCLEGKSSSLNKHAKSITSPTFETLLDWFEYFVDNYDSDVYSGISRSLANSALRKYIYENCPERISSSRRFKLIENSATAIDNFSTTKDRIDYLHNLKNRDIYEIMVNDFN